VKLPEIDDSPPSGFPDLALLNSLVQATENFN
jgi:hypothetical protein